MRLLFNIFGLFSCDFYINYVNIVEKKIYRILMIIFFTNVLSDFWLENNYTLYFCGNAINGVLQLR